MDDVRRFGSLSSISTYPFENFLHMIKQKLRAMNKPLQQLSRRMAEIACVADHTQYFEDDTSNNHSTILKFPLKNDRTKFRTVIFKDYRLSSLKFGDKWFLDRYNRIIEFIYATNSNGIILLHGCEIEYVNNVFEKPVSSSRLNIHKAYYNDNQPMNEVISKIEDIKSKMVCSSFESELIFQPLLHTLC